ncbi:MAG: hypothetical protein C0601_10600 [Candidatus Muiribacterium halophilum]|uniref:Uncharacterized protein n=1 Tax=Muiribacterium halophilum TaxID=2053465 RepID=A0A2N5ZCC3_MUIH1|nr:MAG: hypothetical protein C0601_10600 [Candidatus Muirbacterium halophilum]
MKKLMLFLGMLIISYIISVLITVLITYFFFPDAKIKLEVVLFVYGAIIPIISIISAIFFTKKITV